MNLIYLLIHLLTLIKNLPDISPEKELQLILIYIYTHIPSQLINQNFRVKWFECASVFKAATNFKDGFRLFSGTTTVHST